MNKVSIIIMKVIRRIVLKITNWYRYTSFVNGLKGYEDGIGVKGPVYLWNDNVSIGNGTNVYQGVTFWGKSEIEIGRNVEIGAQALVNKDIPAYAIAVGVPARVIGYRK